MPIESLQLVCGVDEYLVEQKARSIVDQTVPEAERALGLEVIDGRAESAGAAVSAVRQCIEALQTPGFFGGQKLVWLKNITFLNPQARPGEEDAVKESVAALTAFLRGGFPAGQRLLITTAAPMRGSAFFKACQSVGKVFDFPGDEKKPWEMEKVAAERLAGLLEKFGLRMPEEVRGRFLRRVGVSTRLLVNELEKLRLYAGREHAEIAAADVDAIVSVSSEAEAWDLTDAFGERDPAALVEALRRLLTQDESAIGLTAMVEARVRELLVLRHALDQQWLYAGDSSRGGSCRWSSPLPAEAERLLAGLRKDPRSVSSFVLRKNAAQASRFTMVELRRARHQLVELRERLVSLAAPPEILLETTLLRLVRRPAPARTR